MNNEAFLAIALVGLVTFPVAAFAWWQWRREPPKPDEDALNRYYRRMTPYFASITLAILLVGVIGWVITR